MKKGPDVQVFRFLLRSVYCLIIICLFLSLSPARAQFLTLPVDLSYLSQRADVIVQGNVIEVLQENHPQFGNIPTVKVTLAVESMLRGPSSPTYTFREILIGARARKYKQGYKVGQRLMLFLPSPSRYGFSSPIGIEQGRFHITRVTEGKETIVNETGNAGLFKDVENTAFLEGIHLSSKQMHLAGTKNGPVSLDDFVGLVKTLTALPRIQ